MPDRARPAFRNRAKCSVKYLESEWARNQKLSFLLRTTTRDASSCRAVRPNGPLHDAMASGGSPSRDPGDVDSSRLVSPGPVFAHPPKLLGQTASRLAFFHSPSQTAKARAIAERIKASVGLDVEWFEVKKDGAYNGTPTVTPSVLGADALVAQLVGPKRGGSHLVSPLTRLSNAHSPAALIAKGEAAVRLGDHARANDAFAQARAAHEEIIRKATPSRQLPFSFTDEFGEEHIAHPYDNDSTPQHFSKSGNAQAVANAFTPFVLTLLDDEVSMDTVLSLLSNGNSSGGGVVVNLNDASEKLVTTVRKRCEGFGMAYVQCALVGEVDAINIGSVEAWIASADGPSAMTATEAVVLRAVCSDNFGNEEVSEQALTGTIVVAGDAETDGNVPHPRIRRVESNDPRDCATPRAAVLASLLAAQTQAMRDAQVNSADKGDLNHLKQSLQESENHANDLSTKLAHEHDKNALLERTLREERKSKESGLNSAERKRTNDIAMIENDANREREAMLVDKHERTTELNAALSENNTLRGRLAVLEQSWDRSCASENSLRAELASVEVSFARFESEAKADQEKSQAQVIALRDALAAARADHDDARRQLLTYETNDVNAEDAFIARDMAETDATVTRGKLAEQVTEARRWRARSDAAERRALEAEKRAEREAMRAVVADAKAKSYHETMANGINDQMLINSQGPGVGVTPAKTHTRNSLAEVFPKDLNAVEFGVFSVPSTGLKGIDESLKPLGDGDDEHLNESCTGKQSDASHLEQNIVDLQDELQKTKELLEATETKKIDAEVREAAANAKFEQIHHDNRDFEATVTGLRREILNAKAQANAVKASCAADTEAARTTVLKAEQTCSQRVEFEVKLRKDAELATRHANDEACKARARADATRVEAEKAISMATSHVSVENEPRNVFSDKKSQTIRDDPRFVYSEREALSFAQQVCVRLEQHMPRARVCVARRSVAKPRMRSQSGQDVSSSRQESTAKVSVVAAGAMSPLVKWFGARGWSSKIAPGSLSHACFAAIAEEQTEMVQGKHVRRVSGKTYGKSVTKNSENSEKILPTIFKNVTSIQLKGSGSNDTNMSNAGIAVACGNRGDLAIQVELSQRVSPTTSVSELAAIHAAANDIAAAFDAADDAADVICSNLFKLLRAEMENYTTFGGSGGEDTDNALFIEKPFDSMHSAITLLEERRAQRSFCEKRLRKYWRAGDGTLRRIVRSDNPSNELIYIPKDGSCQVLVTTTRAAGIVAGVSLGIGVGNQSAKRAFASCSSSYVECEQIINDVASEKELSEKFGIKPLVAKDPGILDRAMHARVIASRKAASHAVRLWEGYVDPDDEGDSEKSSRNSLCAVASRLVFGDDGVDKMHARSIEVGLGPERDFSGVDLGLRESAPLVATLLDGDGGDTERENKSSVDPVTTSAAISLWLWTSTCLSTWRLMRHIQRTERIGVFDVHTVSAKLLERQKAGATIGRYWKTHSARFFSNAKKTKRKQDERSLQSYLGKIQV